MARAYRMTSARRAAIRKAQQASARKRRGRKKAKIAVSSLGVVAVTVAAGYGYRKYGARKKSKSMPVTQNIVQVTTPSIVYSNSKEIDVFRETIDSSTSYTRKGKPKVNYGKVGKPIEAMTVGEIKNSSKGKGRGNKNRPKGKGRHVTPQQGGPIQKVLRYRPQRNEKRRMDYSPIKRSISYKKNAEKISDKRYERIARENEARKQWDTLRNIFARSRAGKISLNNIGRLPQSQWPLN